MNNKLELAEVMTLGKALAESKYFTDAKEASQAVVKILAGQELGIKPVAAMTGLYIVKGKVAIGGNIMASLIKASPNHDYKIVDHTDQVCEIEFFENEISVGVSDFSIKDADRAGLKGDNWKQYPRNMLFNRTISNGIKWFFPHLLNGQAVYTPDELELNKDPNFIVENLVEAETTTPQLSSGDDESRQLRIDEIFNHDDYPIDGSPKEQIDFLNTQLEAEGLKFRAVTIPELMEFSG